MNETVEKVKVHLFPGPRRRRRWGVSSRANNKKSLPAEAVLREIEKQMNLKWSSKSYYNHYLIFFFKIQT